MHPIEVSEAVVSEYKDLVFRIAVSYVKNRHDADDIFQEVFLTYFRKDRIFESRDHQKAWFIKVCVNQCKRYFIKANQRNVVSLLEHDQAVEPQKDFSDIYESIVALKPKYRIVIFLFYIEQLSVAEIAFALGKSQSSIKTSLHRGRKLMRERIEHDE